MDMEWERFGAKLSIYGSLCCLLSPGVRCGSLSWYLRLTPCTLPQAYIKREVETLGILLSFPFDYRSLGLVVLMFIHIVLRRLTLYCVPLTLVR